jgi:hypothetical protein
MPDPNQPPTPPPYEPAPGGYTPPTAGPAPYQPPAGGGYAPPGGQPPYQPAAGGYGGGYSAPPKKAGFNWLACCGIGCGVVLVLTILVCALMWKVVAPFVGMGVSAAKVGEEVQKTDLATIKGSAEAVDAATLAASPESYKDKWLDLTATLDAAPQNGASYGGQQGTSYMTKEMVMISDLSNAPAIGQPGDTIHAYGRIVIMDIGSIPFIKESLEEEAAKNPGTPVPTKFVMFMAKGVEGAGMATDKPADEADSPADGEGGGDTAPPAEESKPGEG